MENSIDVILTEADINEAKKIHERVSNAQNSQEEEEKS
jgi:hypothetical protein